MLAWGLASLGAGSESARFFPACAAALLADEGGMAAHSAYGLSTLAWSFGRVRNLSCLHPVLQPSREVAGWRGIKRPNGQLQSTPAGRILRVAA